MNRAKINRLTINHIAAASLRTGKKAYLSLAAGIFLSIFLVTSMFLCVSGAMDADRNKAALDIGYQDTFIIDSTYTDTELMESGFYDEIGHAYISGRISTSAKAVGWYDETGDKLMNRRVIEGRMPEQAGEAALESHVLDYLRIDAKVGDEITLPITPIDGVDEQRTFHLVGILTEQSSDLTDYRHMSGFDNTLEALHNFPVVLLHESEPAFQTGRVAVHQLMTISDQTTLYDAMKDWEERRWNNSNSKGILYGCYNTSARLFEAEEAQPNFMSSMTAMIVVVMAVSLMIACCVGIAQALESRLSQRVDQIAMLRAVGATKRQIKKIFGREAWMLALLLSPLSVGAGCLFAFALSKLFPEFIAYRFNAELLIPIVLLSAACILIASQIPLRRACRIHPMGVIRDIEMLRKIKRVRSKTTFNAPKLIASRQAYLHRGRQAGAVILVALMLLCVGGAGILAVQRLNTTTQGDTAEFEIRMEPPEQYDDFADVVPYDALTSSDLAQLAALPYVDRVETMQELYVLLNVQGTVPEYLKYDVVNMSGDHLLEDSSDNEKVRLEHKEVLSGLGKEGTLVQLKVLVLPENQIRALSECAVSGDIDVGAINEGREVLVYAPVLYRHWIQDGWSSYWHYSVSDKVNGNLGESYQANDAFSVGQSLSLTHVWRTEDEVERWNRQWTAAEFAEMDRTEAQPSVGAVLDGETSNIRIHYPCLITSRAGAEHMGMNLSDLEEIRIYLSGDVDLQTEQYLDSRIRAISARGNTQYVWNNIEDARGLRQMFIQLALLIGAVAVVFFSVSFSMISGNVKRRIHADERMIGTLRAVGADKRALVSCYSPQVVHSVVWGFVWAAAAVGVVIAAVISLPAFDVAIAAGGMLLCAGVCCLLCISAMSRAIGNVMKRSIVENIREL